MQNEAGQVHARRQPVKRPTFNENLAELGYSFKVKATL